MPRCRTSTASRLRARVALLALLTAGLAGADRRIEVPEGCGTDLEWQTELERLTPASAASPREIRVQIARLGPSDFELRLSIGDERRVLRDPVCRVLWRSALVIAAAASRPEPESPPPASAAAPASSVAPSPAAPPPSPAPPSPAPPSQQRPSAAPTSTPRPAPGGAAPASAVTATRRTAPQRNARPRRPPRDASASVARSPSRAAPHAPPTSDRAASGGDVARLGASLGLGVSSGVVPGWGPAFGVSLHLEKGPWAVALGLQHWPEQGQSLDSRSVLVSATGGRAAALFRVTPALDLWAGLELNRLLGEGSANVQSPASDVAWQLAPVFGASLITMDIGYLRLELGALARLSLIRPRFEVTGFGTLYRAPPLAADAMIRGVLLFW